MDKQSVSNNYLGLDNPVDSPIEYVESIEVNKIGDVDIKTTVEATRVYQNNQNYGLAKMLDGNDNSFWHGQDTSVNEKSGIRLTFDRAIPFTGLSMPIRHDCCNGRYSNVCMIIGQTEVCTDDTGNGEPLLFTSFTKKWLEFSVPMQTIQVVELIWKPQSTVADNWAQVPEVALLYNPNPPRPAVCRSWGDPHVETFDGLRNDVYGQAWYQLSETTPAGLSEGLEYFQVALQTRRAGRVAYSKASWMVFYSVDYTKLYKVKFTEFGQSYISVDGSSFFPLAPQDNVDFKVIRSGTGRVARNVIETWFGLKLGQAKTTVIVSLPAKFSNKVYGVCGNSDGVREDDWTLKDGTPCTDDVENGNRGYVRTKCELDNQVSFIIDPDAGGLVTGVKDPELTCDDSAATQCKAELEESSFDGCANVIDRQKWIDSCTVDVCQIERTYTNTDAYVCEDNTHEIVCPAGSIIHIRDAKYGRWNSSTCPSSAMGTCDSFIDHTDAVRADCEGKQSCFYTASNTYGDPCGGIQKYTDIDYACVKVDQAEMKKAIDEIKTNMLDECIEKAPPGTDITPDPCLIDLNLPCDANMIYKACATPSDIQTCAEFVDNVDPLDTGITFGSCICTSGFKTDVNGVCVDENSCVKPEDEYSDWGEWGDCISNGSSGTKTRIRVCFPIGGTCIGPNSDTVACDPGRPTCGTGVCRAWGDPHVETFDGLRNDVYGEAWYQLSQTTEAGLSAGVPYFNSAIQTRKRGHVAYNNGTSVDFKSVDGNRSYRIEITATYEATITVDNLIKIDLVPQENSDFIFSQIGNGRRTTYILETWFGLRLIVEVFGERKNARKSRKNKKNRQNTCGNTGTSNNYMNVNIYLPGKRILTNGFQQTYHYFMTQLLILLYQNCLLIILLVCVVILIATAMTTGRLKMGPSVRLDWLMPITVISELNVNLTAKCHLL